MPTVALIRHPAQRRWLFLGLVLIGLLTLHFLGRRDSAGDLRIPTSTAVAGPAADYRAAADSTVDSASATMTAATAATAPAGGGHVLITDCALLLLLAAVSGLVALRAAPIRTTGAAGRPELCRIRRGPPKSLPRIVLCVERI